MTAQTAVSSNPVEQIEATQAVVSPQAGTQRAARIGSIDGLRALAMFMVFTFHVWEFGDSPALTVRAGGSSLSFGHLFGSFPAGVDLFMVLSGFCLFWPLAKSEKRLREWTAWDYLKRRFRRIAPPYYAAIIFVSLLPDALVLVYHLLGKQANWQRLPSFWDYAAHFLFIHTLFLKTWTSIQGAFWSLGLEMQFYLAFPLVVYCYRKYGIRVVFWMAAISITYRFIAGKVTDGMVNDLPFLVSIFFLGRWMQFASGMAAAWIVANLNSRDRMITAAHGSMLLAGAVALYFIAIVPAVSRGTLGLLAVQSLLFSAAYAAAIVALCASTTRLRVLFENRLVTWLGFISYTIFLIHQNTVYYVGEFFKKVHPLSGPQRFFVLETIGFVLIVAISTIFFKYFEAPFVASPDKKSVLQNKIK